MQHNRRVVKLYMVEMDDLEEVELDQQTKQEVKFFREYLGFQILEEGVVEELIL